MLFLLLGISLHNTNICCLTLKPSLGIIYLFYTVIKNAWYLSVTYKRNQYLRKILSPLLISRTYIQNEWCIENCNRKCNICKKFLIVSTDWLVASLLPCINIKLKKSWIVKVEILFIWYPANFVGSIILGLPLA